jgi:hypothetical protein
MRIFGWIVWSFLLLHLLISVGLIIYKFIIGRRDGDICIGLNIDVEIILAFIFMTMYLF